jgi:RNAse (barnase) inhibitor barstar
MVLVRLDTRLIQDWETFHDVFQSAFGFPDFYGRNMNAWIDCKTSLDDPDAGLSTVHVQRSELLVMQLDHVDDLCARCPEQYQAIVDCSAFVNWRRIEMGDNAVIALSFYKSP